MNYSRRPSKLDNKYRHLKFSKQTQRDVKSKKTKAGETRNAAKSERLLKQPTKLGNRQIELKETLSELDKRIPSIRMNFHYLNSMFRQTEGLEENVLNVISSSEDKELKHTVETLFNANRDMRLATTIYLNSAIDIIEQLPRNSAAIPQFAINISDNLYKLVIRFSPEKLSLNDLKVLKGEIEKMQNELKVNIKKLVKDGDIKSEETKQALNDQLDKMGKMMSRYEDAINLLNESKFIDKDFKGIKEQLKKVSEERLDAATIKKILTGSLGMVGSIAATILFFSIVLSAIVLSGGIIALLLLVALAAGAGAGGALISSFFDEKTAAAQAQAISHLSDIMTMLKEDSPLSEN